MKTKHGRMYRMVMDVDEKKQGDQKASIGHSSLNGEKIGKTFFVKDTMSFATHERFEDYHGIPKTIAY